MNFFRLSYNKIFKNTSKLIVNKMKNLTNIFITPSNTEIEKKLISLLNQSDNYKISNSHENSIKIYLDYSDQNSNNFSNDYDIRILIGKEESESIIVDRILNSLEKDQEYISTRGSKNNYTFYDVIRDGLASDRGLFVPKYFPRLNSSQFQRLVPLTYQERCLRILEGFPLGELKPSQLSKMIYEAFSTFTDENIIPLYKVPDRENQYIMEEFYGPSASFKDLALQLFPRLFEESIKNYNKKIAILVATSGDTGSAVLSGFKEIGIPVIVLYPHKKVSQIQEAQMITAEGNVKVIAVKGDFDYCQSCVKDIFQDSEFTTNLKNEFNLSLTSANSINWGRLLPQVCYVIHSYLEMVKSKNIEYGTLVDVCIPSGNFGNILGGFIAKRMGLPIDKLICASNENNILTDFINTGEFDLRNRELLPTISPAIDILLPSNIERLLYFITNDPKLVKTYFDELSANKYFKIDHKIKYAIMTDFLADFCTEEEQIETIREVYKSTNYILDPHTAVAKKIADKYSKKRKNPILIASTAHYAKFPETVMEALNIPQGSNLKENIENLKMLKTTTVFHKNLDEIMNKSVLHKQVLDNDIGQIKKAIYDTFKEKQLV